MYKISLLLLILFTLLLFLPVNLDARYFARWHTTMGDFTAELRDELAPITANNFINLTNAHFYDNLHFHRVIPDFVIQDGDPLGTGFGGPGYTIADEFDVGLYHDSPGVIAMANTGQPHSAGSQYYITLSALPSLDYSYAIFGKVLQGMDVVQSISLVPTNANDHPITDVTITTLEILGLVINSVSPADSVVTFDLQNPYPFVMESYGLVTNANYQWLVDDVVQNVNDFLITPNFIATGLHTVKCITSDETVSWAFTWHVTVSGTANDDPVATVPSISLTGNYPNPFRTSTSLLLQSSKNMPVTINVYNLKGQKTITTSLITKVGYNTWSWNGKDSHGIVQPSGVYLFEVVSPSGKQVKKAIRLH